MKSTRDVVWCGVVWCGVVWCGVVWSHPAAGVALFGANVFVPLSSYSGELWVSMIVLGSLIGLLLKYDCY